MSLKFDAQSIAFKALGVSKEVRDNVFGEEKKSSNSKPLESDRVADTQKFLWVSDGKVNMSIPVDGWNALHWYRYFSMHFRNVFDHMYTGKNRTDMLCMGSFLFRAQRELGMSSSEVKSCIDWIAGTKMPMIKAQGRIYFIAMLKDDLNDFYNAKIFPTKHSDEKNNTKNRDLFIDQKDFRESIKKFLIFNESKIEDFDLRILIQLGIPVILEYLTVQENISITEAKKIVLDKIERVINDDLSKAHLGKPRCLRFEKILKNSLDWEPYPWNDFEWRKMVDKAIKFLDIDKEKWWRPNPPIASIKPASCLKILKSKKRV